MRRGPSRNRKVATRGIQSTYKLRSAGPLSDPATPAVNMAAKFVNRDDPEYISYIEDKLLESVAAREKDSKVLSDIVTRLDRYDEKQAPSGRGRGILYTPSSSSSKPGGMLGRSVSVGTEEPSAADVINGPLTKVLQQLSVAIDPTPQASVKGLLLRPEYYIQHIDKGVSVKSLDHTKLTFKELISGMGRVMLHLICLRPEVI